MNNNDKITFDELIQSGRIASNEHIDDGKIFHDEPRKRDFTIPILCIIAALFIGACVYYTHNAYTKLSGTIKVSGTTAQSQLNKDAEQYKNGKVNLNTAGVDVLCTLEGIGETRALAIMTHREVKGPFNKIEDLKKVKGIGEDTFKKIKNEICV